MIIPSLDYEKQYWSQGILVAGVDEAGRGALAGPVVAAGVIFPIDFEPSFDVFDSKTINAKKREKLYEQILENCLAYSVKMISPEVIDGKNILKATFDAMDEVLSELSKFEPFALIDGNRYKGKFAAKTIVDGDALCFSIASASIIAKVERDRWMLQVAHAEYPQYGFNKHKGYGTKQHIENILKYSPSPLHRKSFLKKILSKNLHPQIAMVEV